jgi:hypothetical protein
MVNLRELLASYATTGQPLGALNLPLGADCFIRGLRKNAAVGSLASRTITQPLWISEVAVFEIDKSQLTALILATGLVGSSSVPTSAALSLAGKVQAGGGPVAASTVTLWAASAAEPTQLAQTRAGSDGRFNLRADATPASDVTLYLTANYRGRAAVLRPGGRSGQKVP